MALGTVDLLVGPAQRKASLRVIEAVDADGSPARLVVATGTLRAKAALVWVLMAGTAG